MLEDFFSPTRARALAVETERALGTGRHGDMPQWQAALQALPPVERGWHIDNGVLVAGEAVESKSTLGKILARLIPWRKGPLRLGGVAIDTEWRSDWKWDRIGPHVDLVGRRVLDIGAGNGYFGYRMLADGARQVVGCDPTLIFWHQFKAIEHFAGRADHLLLPLKFEQLPAAADFDLVFSMGVLYHRKNPLEHLQRIRDHLAPGGRAVIETLVIPGESDDELDPPDRYANMRNVHHLPTVTRLQRWLAETGFTDIRTVDVAPTTTGEQRSTDWMPFHSLEQALSPDAQTTVEGHPPPLRAVTIAERQSGA